MNDAVDQKWVAPNEARLELSRILASPDFASSRQLTNFLQYIVSETLAGRSESLKERTVAIALGRGSDFDPRLDCVVRVTAGKLRRSLERYYALHGPSDAVHIEVPKGGYCPVFRRQGLAARTSVDVASTLTLDGSAQRTGERAKIAVVSLKSITSDPEERLLANLLADNVTVRLGRMSRLEVIDCTTTCAYPAEDLCQLASRLHANFALGGTVSKVGRHVRVTVRLIDGDRSVLAWADQYDLHIGDKPLEQHDDIAGHISTCIGRLLT